MARRKPGTLVPLEIEILAAAQELLRSGSSSFHGFGLARAMRERSGSRSLTAHGTLYKALARLERFGLLSSSWEDVEDVAGRPRRRLYQLTPAGAEMAERAAPAGAGEGAAAALSAAGASASARAAWGRA